MTDLNLITQNAFNFPLKIEDLFGALDAFSQEFKKGTAFRLEMESLLQRANISEDEITLGLDGIESFLSAKSLRKKIERELGSQNPFELKRVSFEAPIFEAWSPLGLLVHITPSNAWSVGLLSGIEGLLAGNVNFIKLSSSDSDFTLKAIERLKEMTPFESIKMRMHAEKISSKDTLKMKEILKDADGVVAWGGEEAIRSLRALTPEGARFIDWGHKISFGYTTKSSQEVADKLVREICTDNQQACSAPQCVYLETDSQEELKEFARFIAAAFNRFSADIPKLSPSIAEQSEITVVKRMQELKRAKGEGDVIYGDDWSVLIDPKSALRPSPLYRNIWVKPIKRDGIVSTLRPLRSYLQTVGLEASMTDQAELLKLFYSAGVLRVTPLGEMMGSYEGEPHDGVFALTRYVKKVSFRGDDSFKSVGRMSEIAPPQNQLQNLSIMTKADFQVMSVDSTLAPLTFRSGGSSGEPKFSRFTYHDYHKQMELAGFGLVAAGLEPSRDRVMNLFYAGGLYGGFVSFFTILESLKATQFPMAASTDFQAVADAIVTHKVDTLIGMPSYLMSLFSSQKEILQKHRFIKKIFFGGEHFQESQKEFLKAEFGIEMIRSAAYGSVDAGPLGYQCQKMHGSQHHLHHDAHDFEIVEIDSDKPSQMGRLLVSTKMREGQTIKRYDIGDLVKRMDGTCECGRQGLRIELMGRHGDVFRVGSSFFNYAKFARILSEELNYSFEFQIRLLGRSKELSQETMVFILDNRFETSDNEIIQVLNSFEHDFKESVTLERVLNFKIVRIETNQFEKVVSSGKLKHIIDERVI